LGYGEKKRTEVLKNRREVQVTMGRKREDRHSLEKRREGFYAGGGKLKTSSKTAQKKKPEGGGGNVANVEKNNS